MQTESALEEHKRWSGQAHANTSDRSVQVLLDELPDFEESVLPALETIVAQSLEQALIEIMEEEEIKEIRRRRQSFQEQKLAELTVSKMMNIES